ncbi:MAG: SH3 domain-containing protein [Chloroflexota bacterium]
MLIRRALLLIILLLSLSLLTQAQSFDFPPESGRAFALTATEGAVQLGELDVPITGTVDIDYNPADPRRWARIDNFGILRFVDPGNPEVAEGVYTFQPFFDGFQAPDAAGNRYFLRDVEWSPDGRMLAFFARNQTQIDLNQGLWFWQPVRELATDPAYQLLRPCPGYCSAAGLPDSYPGWEVLDFAWSSDNSAILVTTFANEYGRRALTIRFAQRVDPPPATVAPDFLRYDYGHWGTNGQMIVVSGNSPDNEVVFGTIDRAGGAQNLTLASDIGMAWVQDAVQRVDESFVMLGSAVGQNAPLQLVDSEGTIITPPIGTTAPSSVEWSPDKSAVLITIEEDLATDTDEQVYLATITGTIYDITETIERSPNITWINGELPANMIPQPLPAPIIDSFQPESTPEPTDVREFAVGDLLAVTSGVLNIYEEPIATGTVVGSLTVGDELIITDGPLQSGDTTWYRVQTLEFTGWVNNTTLLDFPSD